IHPGRARPARKQNVPAGCKIDRGDALTTALEPQVGRTRSGSAAGTARVGMHTERRVIQVAELDSQVVDQRRGLNARRQPGRRARDVARSEEHTSELQSPCNLVCRLLLEKKNTTSYSSK